MLKMEAQGDLVPAKPAAPMPDILKSQNQSAAGNAPAGAEAEPVPTREVSPAAENAPAETEAEKKDTGSKPKYTAEQWADPSLYEEARHPKGHKYEQGRVTKQNRRDSNLPEGTGPEMWAIMTPKKKREAKLALATVVVSLGPAPVPKMPKMPAMNSNGPWNHREKCGDPFGLCGSASVARSVKPKELEFNKKASGNDGRGVECSPRSGSMERKEGPRVDPRQSQSQEVRCTHPCRHAIWNCQEKKVPSSPRRPRDRN